MSRKRFDLLLLFKIEVCFVLYKMIISMFYRSIIHVDLQSGNNGEFAAASCGDTGAFHTESRSKS